MGLDMYLFRAKRNPKYRPEDLDKFEEYLYIKNRVSVPKATQYAIDNNLSDDGILFYEKCLHTTYYDWDIEKKYPHDSISDEVGYWRKVNHVHKWFVDEVQDGNDDCGSYEVGEENLKKLQYICEKIIENCTIENEEKEITNKQFAEDMLPRQSGFFFGDYSYDKYYLSSINDTLEIVNKVLSETDFEKEIVYYHSSW